MEIDKWQKDMKISELGQKEKDVIHVEPGCSEDYDNSNVKENVI
jgi:hypothetical protein